MTIIIQSSPTDLRNLELSAQDTLIDAAGKRQIAILSSSDSGALPDIEIPDAHIWRANEHSSQGNVDKVGRRIVVERLFDAPISSSEIRDREARGDWCLDTHGVTFLRSYSSEDRTRMVCIYTATDVESVRHRPCKPHLAQ